MSAAPWYPRRAGVVTVTGPVDSPAIRQGEVWSIQEYISSKSKQQKPETGLVLPTSWLSPGVGARTSAEMGLLLPVWRVRVPAEAGQDMWCTQGHDSRIA